MEVLMPSCKAAARSGSVTRASVSGPWSHSQSSRRVLRRSRVDGPEGGKYFSRPARGSFVLKKRQLARAASSAVGGLQPAEEENIDDLKIVEPLFKGLARDVRVKAPYFLSDIKDGLNTKALASTLFMFFACLAPAVAFGSLLSVKTQGAMGALEMIVSTSTCGMLYAVLSGQPVTIIGSTGPVLAFTAILYSTCQRLAIPFLASYAWVGLWTSAILGMCALTSTSNLVIKYLTRFTDEIFAGLISVIFVAEALKDVARLLFTPEVSAAAALLSISMALLTCYLALKLRSVRATPYLNKPAREVISDFGPTIAIIGTSCLCLWLCGRYAIDLQFLQLPPSLTPTAPRPWLVDIWQAPTWVRWGASVPAVMVSILMFFDQNITTRLVNSKDNKMTKGYGYHIDLAIVSFNTAVMSMLGMPWLVAATVRSINHLRSLSNYEEGGEGEVLVGVMENRVTAFGIHALIGASIVFARDILRNVPQCVLMGLFLYLGLSAIKGNTFLERIELYFMERKKMPQVPYVKDIKLSSTHKFTALQVACLALLVALKESKYGILFPVVIAALQVILVVAVRAKWFTDEELAVLDKE